MKLTIWLPAIVLVFLSVAALADDKMAGAHDFSFVAIDESEQLDLKAFAGKPILVVNTASFCGFTHQYSGLEALWRAYRDQGLVVVGVPSNDFGAQEPKSEKEIKSFCQGAFNITFPLTKKTKVRGPDAHGFYRWIAKSTSGKASPRWNFHKLLIGKDGRLEHAFPSSVEPGSEKLKRAIEAALTSPAGSS